MAAHRLRWRGAAVRAPAVSRANRSCSRDTIASGGSSRTVRAASSSASGNPSSRRHRAATAPALASVIAKPGADSPARSMNSSTASLRRRSGTDPPSGGRPSAGTG